MTTSKVTDSLTKAQDSFRTAMLETYELDQEVVEAICGLFLDSAKPLAEEVAAAAPKRARASGVSDDKKAKKPRKKSAYNVFVREQMKTDEIKSVPHKAKMGAIAQTWKALSDEDRVQYHTLADTENGTVEPEVEADAETNVTSE